MQVQSVCEFPYAVPTTPLGGCPDVIVRTDPELVELGDGTGLWVGNGEGFCVGDGLGETVACAEAFVTEGPPIADSPVPAQANSASTGIMAAIAATNEAICLSLAIGADIIVSVPERKLYASQVPDKTSALSCFYREKLGATVNHN